MSPLRTIYAVEMGGLTVGWGTYLETIILRGCFPLKEIQMFLIKEGNYFNVPVKVYYIEDSTDTSVLPDNAPTGSIALANDSTNGVGPRFPGPLLIRTRCPDTSPNSSL